jgi:hypothetical protein
MAIASLILHVPSMSVIALAKARAVECVYNRVECPRQMSGMVCPKIQRIHQRLSLYNAKLISLATISSMGLKEPCLNEVCVSGTKFRVPDDLYAYLKDLPPRSKSEYDKSSNEVVMVNADPDTFRFLLDYTKHHSLSTNFWKSDENVEALHALAVSLGMTDLVLYLGNHNKPQDGFLKLKLKRSSSWQKRAREMSKRKLDALATSIRGPGSVVRKLTSPSYEQLVHQSQQVM